MERYPEKSISLQENKNYSENQPEELNFHQIARERVELRRSLNSLESLGDDSSVKDIADQVKEGLEAIDQEAKKFSIAEDGGLSKAKVRLKGEKEKSEQSAWLDDKSIGEEFGSLYNKRTFGGYIAGITRQDLFNQVLSSNNLIKYEIVFLRCGSTGYGL